MATYKTPGVYIEEVSLFPPSVAEVETAIPAFIGYTEKASKNGTSLINVPTAISSLLDYEAIFGGAPALTGITVTLDANNRPSDIEISPNFHLYNSLRLFFDNGGGRCYIVSVNTYTDDADQANSVDYDELEAGLNAVAKYDEPTMLLFPDAVILNNAQFYTLQQKALLQCEKLQDRVAILDLLESPDWEAGKDDFRNNIGVNALKYGAAYTPYLKSAYKLDFSYGDISLQDQADTAVALVDIIESNNSSLLADLISASQDVATLEGFLNDPISAGSTLADGYTGIATAGETQINNKVTYLDAVLQAFMALSFNNVKVTAAFNAYIAAGGKLQTTVETLAQYDADYYTGTSGAPTSAPLGIVLDGNYSYDLSGISANAATASIYHTTGNPGDDQFKKAANASNDFAAVYNAIEEGIAAILAEAQNAVSSLGQKLANDSTTYNAILEAINEAASITPPSGAIAGVYTYVDNTRGVWKAPANVSLTAIAGLTESITTLEQDDLNIDSTAGKSINAIRAFTGRGTLVWGARTLAGNDNEWRYISVRRFFNMVEESIKKSTAWAVFEPNDANTWTKVKGMIENYLTEKWREGALTGSKPDQAFFVNVGLGLTMTAQDVLEGRMIVEIGMAVVRPAEFIILRFSHKLQEA